MTRLNKYDLVTEVAMLCDERDAYKRELDDLRRGIEAFKSAECEGFDVNDLLCLQVGRKKVFEEHTASWRTVSVCQNEVTGKIECTSFEDFREEACYSCPDTMSKSDFFEYFDAELRDMYEKAKAKAIAAVDTE